MRKLKIIEQVSPDGVIRASGEDGHFRKAFIITKVVDGRVGTSRLLANEHWCVNEGAPWLLRH